VRELETISIHPVYQAELAKAISNENTMAKLILNPFHLNILSAETLTPEEVNQVERCVTAACYFIHIQRWKMLSALQEKKQ